MDKNGEDKMPDIEMKFMFLQHVTQEEAEALEEDIKNCDVYCPEILFWNEKLATELNDLQIQGISLIDQMRLFFLKAFFSYDPYMNKVIDIIYQYKKPVLIVDVFDGNNVLKKQDEESKALLNKSFEDFLQGNFEMAENKIREHMLKEVDFENKRLKIINKNINNLLPELINKNLELRKKKKLKVLFSYGAFHASLTHDLRKQGFKVEREFSARPFVYIHWDTLLRRQKFLKNKSVSKKELLYVFVDVIFMQYFLELNKVYLEAKENGLLSQYFSKKLSRII